MGHLRLQRQPLRWFWGLRLHLLATPAGLPIAAALTGATADERDTCPAMIAHADPARPAQTLIADKDYRSAAFEKQLAQRAITLIRPATKTEPPQPHQRFPAPLRQIIESTFRTLKAQPGLKRHGGRSPADVTARILQRLPALTAAIRHNQTTHQPDPTRNLLAYDHRPLGTNHLGVDCSAHAETWGGSRLRPRSAGPHRRVRPGRRTIR